MWCILSALIYYLVTTKHKIYKFGHLCAFMLEDLTFLEEGEYTKRDDVVRDIARDIGRQPGSVLDNIGMYVANIRYKKSDENFDKNKVFRKRTASEVLDSKYVTGCTDVALAFIVLAREAGIPTRFIETFDKNWLKNLDPHNISGHIFVDVLVEDKWRVYEPKTGFTKNNEYLFGDKEYVEVGKGLDFSEIYLKENGIYRKESMAIKSSEDMRIIGKKMKSELN